MRCASGSRVVFAAEAKEVAASAWEEAAAIRVDWLWGDEEELRIFEAWTAC